MKNRFKILLVLSTVMMFSLCSIAQNWQGPGITGTSGKIHYTGGNVGIGTTSPGVKLDLKLNTDTDFLRIIRNSSLGRSQLVLADENANQIWRFGITGSGSNNFSFYDGTQTTLLLEQNGDILLNPAGNVGIGTPDAEMKLHTNSTGANNVALFESTDAFALLHLKDNTSSDSELVRRLGDVTEFYSGAVRHIHLDGSGNVGIGTTSPMTKLHIKQNDAKGLHFERSGHDSYEIRLAGSKGLWFLNATDGTYDMAFDGSGNVSIGTTTAATGYKLSVAGKIISEEVKVQLQTSWPDYVFSKNYNLLSLAETESYIKEAGHLPNIPSAQEVNENGIELGAMNAKLLQKIEELTLHLIDQQKRIEKLERNAKK